MQVISVNDLRYKHTKGHLDTFKSETTALVGFHLYYENSVVQNFVKKIMLGTNILKKKNILMMTVDMSTYKQVGCCNVWTGQAANDKKFRIVRVDGAYDVFQLNEKKHIHMGTATSVYVPIVPKPIAIAVPILKIENTQEELRSYVVQESSSSSSDSSESYGITFDSDTDTDIGLNEMSTIDN